MPSRVPNTSCRLTFRIGSCPYMKHYISSVLGTQNSLFKHKAPVLVLVSRFTKFAGSTPFFRVVHVDTSTAGRAKAD